MGNRLLAIILVFILVGIRPTYVASTQYYGPWDQADANNQTHALLQSGGVVAPVSDPRVMFLVVLGTTVLSLCGIEIAGNNIDVGDLNLEAPDIKFTPEERLMLDELTANDVEACSVAEPFETIEYPSNISAQEQEVFEQARWAFNSPYMVGFNFAFERLTGKYEIFFDRTDPDQILEQFQEITRIPDLMDELETFFYTYTWAPEYMYAFSEDVMSRESSFSKFRDCFLNRWGWAYFLSALGFASVPSESFLVYTLQFSTMINMSGAG